MEFTAKIVSPLIGPAKERDIELEVITRGKDAAENEKLWERALDMMKGVRPLRQQHDPRSYSKIR